MRYAAFFRNVNLGHPRCPSRAQFEGAFEQAGAAHAASFRSNGTLVFDAPRGTTGRAILSSAHRALQVECALIEPAYLRTLAHLSSLVAQHPFAAIDPASVYACCISFLPPTRIALPDLPLASKSRAVELLQVTRTEILSVSRQVGQTPGIPNAFLEKLLGVAVTTRVWDTVVRLVERHA